MGLPASHRISVPHGTQGQQRETSSFSPTGVSPAMPGLSSAIRLTTGFVTPSSPCRDLLRLTTPNLQRRQSMTQLGLGCSLFARHYSGNGLSSWRYLDVSVPAVPSAWPMVQPAVTEYCSAGFPHSDIPGSVLDDSSPRLIAAIHVLHRLLTPRHPPYALSSLIHTRSTLLDTSAAMPVAPACLRLTTHSAQLLRC